MAFPIRKTDFGERKQLFRRIFDQPARIRTEQLERNPLDPTISSRTFEPVSVFRVLGRP
jgi:hypothetical protein